MRRTWLALASCALAALLAAGGTLLYNAHSTAARQAREITQLQQQARRFAPQISALQSSVSTLLGEVGNPSDPLSAYDQICNEQFTNSATGADQTYYLPCTNNAQTIPQPGN